MRTVFLGTSEFAAAVLGRLADHRERPEHIERFDPDDIDHPDRSGGHGAHRPVLVLTRPDRPAGRGRKLTPPPVAERARALGLRVAQPESVNDPATHELIASVEPEVLVVCAFGALIKEPLLSAYEMLNVHPSLLPRWRGAAPIERAIIAGDSETGVSIMRLTAGLDSGPVCLSASEPILTGDTYGSLAERLERLGGELLVDALDALERREPLHFVAQDESLVTYAEKIAPPDRLLDSTRPAVELERLVRALTPHIGARVALADGTVLGVGEATLAPPDTPPGEGVYERDGHLLLGCSPGALELLTVRPPGKRPMDASAYLRGHAG